MFFWGYAGHKKLEIVRPDRSHTIIMKQQTVIAARMNDDMTDTSSQRNNKAVIATRMSDVTKEISSQRNDLAVLVTCQKFSQQHVFGEDFFVFK